MTLDNRQTFKTYMIEFESEVRHSLINETELQEEVIYQRFIRDKGNKYIKSFNNTIINCSFNPKEKEIFFICKNSIYRGRIFRWYEYVTNLINEGKYLESLRTCLEIFAGRLNIFTEKVVIN